MLKGGVSFIKKLYKRDYDEETLVKKIIYGLFASIIIYLFAFLLSVVFDRVLLVGLYQLLLKIQDLISMSNIEQIVNLQTLTIFRYFSPVVQFSMPRIYFFSVFIYMFLLFAYWKKAVVIRYRYCFAILLFVMLVLGKFTGSSLGFFDGMLYDNTEEYVGSTLLGIPQGLRGDEWATEKPYYFAQGNVSYDYYNSNLALDGCDMVVSAFAPVKDILIIARPDLWGFLFLPQEYAFAFYWNLRLILLFMASFELGYMLTKKAKYGVLWALLISFATPVQWWLSQVLMIIVWSGEYFIVFADKIFGTNDKKKKLIYSLLAAWCAVIYVLTMYPATQVPMGYIFAALFIYIIYRNKDMPSIFKSNIWCAILILGVVAIFGVYYLKMSGDALGTMLGTYYPGKSRSWVKLNWDYELLKIVNPIMWCKYIESINNCEASQYYSFGIFVVIGLVINQIKNPSKKKELDLSILLAVVCGFLWVVSYLPEIPILNKITLLSFSYPVRILYAVGYGFMLAMLIMLAKNEGRNLKIDEKKVIRNISIIVFVIFGVLAMNSTLLTEYFGSGNIAKIIILLFGIGYVYMGYLLLIGGEKATNRFGKMLIAISVFSTMFVNPITYGTDSMFEKTEMKMIREISSENDGRWMVSGNTTIANLVTAQGVARTSGTYYYPDITMMKIIDPNENYEKMWNQFAHIDMRLTTGENYITQFDDELGYELGGTDRIVYINIETAKELEIKYIFSKYQMPEEYVLTGQVEQIYYSEIDNWGIYVIN